MRNRNIVFIIIIVFLIGGMLYGQSGSRFPEFAKKMEYYFDKELIADLEKALPQGVNYTIWGWDVGDFSGDGHYDVAFVVRMASERKRIVQVYLFVDMDGFLTQVAKFPYKFINTPLEVGIIIKSNACLITKKHKQFNWSIRGYSFLDGNLVLYDDYTTERKGKFTKETYCNYQKLESTLKYVLTKKKQTKFFTKYTTIPAYPRGRIIYRGYSSEAHISDIDFISRGAWYWTGEQDGSYDIKTVYDDEYLYISMKIRDDNFVPQYCDTCIGDYVQLWFDFSNINSKTSRFPQIKRNRVISKNNKNEEIFSITIYPGDFYDKRAYVSAVSSTRDLEDYQKAAVKNIRTAAVLRDSGYVIKAKIPFRLFGYEVAPVDEDNFATIGFTSVFHDIDNEFRPEEETEIAMSKFNPAKPVSYAEILLIPQDKWYGSAKNFYRRDILRFLLELGF